jgi:hypothetical protein
MKKLILIFLASILVLGVVVGTKALRWREVAKTKKMEERVRENAVETNGVDRVKSVSCKRGEEFLDWMFLSHWKCALVFVDLDQAENYSMVYVRDNVVPHLFVIQTW